MNIEETRKNTWDIRFGEDSFSNYLDRLKQVNKEGENHLSLFLGLYIPDKKEALDKIVKETGIAVNKIDLHNYVVKSEEKTIENLNRIFLENDDSGSLLYFENGDKLCGAYTGFTHSRVKYASPQERHFLKLIQGYKGIVIIDISEYNAADKTIRRAAQSIVRFDLPSSPLKRFLWHLKNYSLHGYVIKSKRPESYGEVTGNA